jgi:hypothetical protein
MTGSRLEADEPRSGTGSAGNKRPNSMESSTSVQSVKKGMKLGKSVIEFKPQHERKYGERVSCRDSKSGNVASAYCMFCVSFGRDVEEGRTRRTTEKRKFFSRSFRTDSYVSHNRICHPTKWKAYCARDESDRDKFFEVDKPVANTMLAYCETKRTFTIHPSSRVVEGIIRDVLLENGANDAENVRALSIFQKSSQEDDEIAGYVAEVKNVDQFLLSLGYWQFNASFRAVSGILLVTKTITGMSRIGSLFIPHYRTGHSPLTVRELAISTANCHTCGEQNCTNLRTKTLMSTDCR